MQFHVTYEIITPESAQHADAAERGFVQAGGWRVELAPHVCGPEAGKIKDECAMPLRQAVELVAAGVMEDSGFWFTEIDPRRNYATGAETLYSLHPPEITPSSYARLRRLLCA